jgi:hypothetical protein
VSRALADRRSGLGRYQRAAEVWSQVLCWWARSSSAVEGRLPERLWQDCRVNARCGVLLGLPGLSARAGGRSVLQVLVAVLLRKLLFRGSFSGRRMKSNYMFKPTPELSLRLLWLGGRRGLTWR